MITFCFAGGVEECKKKWSSIRDQLRRTLQKRKTKSGQATGSIRKYKFEDVLSFLVPFLGEREGVTNVLSQQNEEEVFEHIEENELETENIENNTDTVLEQPTVEDEIPSNTPRPPSRNQFQNTTFTKPKHLKRKIQRIPESSHKIHCESPSSQLMAFILAEKAAEKSALQKEQHAVDAFLAGIAPTLKSLSPELLIEAKGKIFNVVQELELKQLQYNNSQENFSMTNYLTFSTTPQSSSSATPKSLQDESSNSIKEVNYNLCNY